MIEVYYLSLSAILFTLLLTLTWNSIRVKQLGKIPPYLDEEGPFVSILIPARNESHQIAECLQSALTQNYSDYEVLLIDDGSTDETYSIARRFSESYPHLHVHRSRPLQEGVYGKGHALAQLAQHAQGEYLFFVDADVRLSPLMIRRVITLFKEKDTPLITVLPLQVCKSFLEHLIVPLFDFAIYSILPIFLVEKTSRPALSATVGQFFALSRCAYDAVGGHQAVQEEMLDELGLTRKVRTLGVPTTLVSGHGCISCRMYENRQELLEGVGKNLFAFSGYRPFRFLAVVLFLFFLFITPYLGLFVTPLAAATPVLLIELLRAVHALRWQYSFVHGVLLAPLSIFFALCLGIYSFAGALIRSQRWKGRALPPSPLKVPSLSEENRRLYLAFLLPIVLFYIPFTQSFAYALQPWLICCCSLLTSALLLKGTKKKEEFFAASFLLLVGGFFVEVALFPLGAYEFGTRLGVKAFNVPIVIGTAWLFVVLSSLNLALLLKKTALTSIESLLQQTLKAARNSYSIEQGINQEKTEFIVPKVILIKKLRTVFLHPFPTALMAGLFAFLYNLLLEPAAQKLDFWVWEHGTPSFFNCWLWFALTSLAAYPLLHRGILTEGRKGILPHLFAAQTLYFGIIAFFHP